MTSADLQATIAHMGSAARAASRVMAASAVAAPNAALRALATAAARGDRGAGRGQRGRRRRRPRRRPGRAARRPPAPDAGDRRDHGGRLRADRRHARPDRRDHRAASSSRAASAVGRMRVPLGVFAMIYESRPNVTIEAASLAIKSGNACILRGGSEAMRSNIALWRLVQAALAEAGLPPDAVQLVQTTDRAAVGHLITSPEAIDVVIPRGGKGLIERIAREAKVPVIKHLDGNCHVYVDAGADLGDGACASSTTPRRRSSAPATPPSRCSCTTPIAARFPAAHRRGVRRQGRRDALRSGGARCCSSGVAGAPARRGDRGRLERGVPRADHQRHRGRRRSTRRSGTSTATARTTPTRSSPTRTRSAMRFLREVDSASVMVNAIDALRRRLRVRPRRRDRHLDRQAARARAGRPGGPDLAEMGRARPGRSAWRLTRAAPSSCSPAARTRPSAWPGRSSATRMSRRSASTTR